MSLGQKHYVVCPQCSCDLRSERLFKHCLQVHGKRMSPTEIAAAVSCMTNEPMRKPSRQHKYFERFFEIQRAEEGLQKYVEKLRAAPRKCATKTCQQQVLPPEEFCDRCKLGQIKTQGPRVVPKGRFTFCNCGAPVVPGESRCYDCLGD
jgi:hypothetical protein